MVILQEICFEAKNLILMKTRNSLLLICGIFYVTAFLMSCEKEYFVPVQQDLEDVSYSGDIIPIFNASCNMAGCHNTGGVSPDLSPDNSYSDLFIKNMVDTITPPSSELYVRMISETKPMPPSGVLKGGQPQAVLAWIDQGALNN
jgi:hypothetical protein